MLLFSATDLKVDNSSLTGESEPQERFPLPEGSPFHPQISENLVGEFWPLSHIVLRSLQVFNSTLIVNGEAWGSKIYY